MANFFWGRTPICTPKSALILILLMISVSLSVSCGPGFNSVPGKGKGDRSGSPSSPFERSVEPITRVWTEVVDGGESIGGGDHKTSIASLEKIKAELSLDKQIELKEAVKLFFKNLEFVVLEAIESQSELKSSQDGSAPPVGNSVLDSSTEKTKNAEVSEKAIAFSQRIWTHLYPPYTNSSSYLLERKNSVYDFISNTPIFPKEGPCWNGKEEKDGSVVDPIANEGGIKICISLTRLSQKIEDRNLKKDLVALIAHEVYHLIDPTNDSQEEEVAHSIGEFATKTLFDLEQSFLVRDNQTTYSYPVFKGGLSRVKEKINLLKSKNLSADIENEDPLIKEIELEYLQLSLLAGSLLEMQNSHRSKLGTATWSSDEYQAITLAKSLLQRAENRFERSFESIANENLKDYATAEKTGSRFTFFPLLPEGMGPQILHWELKDMKYSDYAMLIANEVTTLFEAVGVDLSQQVSESSPQSNK